MDSSDTDNSSDQESLINNNLILIEENDDPRFDPDDFYDPEIYSTEKMGMLPYQFEPIASSDNIIEV